MELVDRYRTMSVGYPGSLPEGALGSAAWSNGVDHGEEEEELERLGVRLRNPNILQLEEDVLYHFALSSKSHDLKRMFGDVKFVCVGGSPRRMERFAHHMIDTLRIPLPAGQALVNIAGAADRYALFKAGPVLAASHGIGMPSFSVMMHELFKILYHADATDVVFYRIGTCGGLGVDAGTVVISDAAVDALFRPQFDLAILGKIVSRPAVLDAELVEELVSISEPDDHFRVVQGTTMCTQDFYEGQARLDGAFCDYTEKDKMAFLRGAFERGVRNIEMESLCFASMCHHAGIKGAVVCVSLLNRLDGDQITASHEQLKEFSDRPQRLVSRVIKRRLRGATEPIA